MSVVEQEGEKIATTISSVRQSAPAAQLLRALADKDQEIKDLKARQELIQKALDELILGGAL